MYPNTITTTIMVMTMNIPTTVPTAAAAMTPELSANRKKNAY